MSTFEEVKLVIIKQDIDVNMLKSGYRAFSSNSYTPIWPLDLKEFLVI